MSEVTAPAAAPATPAPAVVSTPVQPSAQVSPGPRHNRPTPNATNTVKKSYDTGGRRSAAAAPAPAAPAPAPAAPAASEAPAAEAAPAAVETPASEAPAAPAAELQLLDGAAKPPEVAAEPEKPAAEPEPEKLPKAELAKRLATIARAEGKLAEEKQRFANEKAQHKQALERVAQMEQAEKLVHDDPLGFMQRMWNVKPQKIVDQLIAISRQNAGQPPAPGQAPAAPSPVEQRVAELEKQLQDGLKKTKEEQIQQQAADYVRYQVVPLVSDKAKYPFLNEEFGTDAADYVYRTMQANWEKGNKEGAKPEVVADFIEKHFREKAAQAAALLSGGSAAPAQTANPKKVAAPQAAPKPAVAQQPPAAGIRRVRLTGKPYTSAVK